MRRKNLDTASSNLLPEHGEYLPDGAKVVLAARQGCVTSVSSSSSNFMNDLARSIEQTAGTKPRAGRARAIFPRIRRHEVDLVEPIFSPVFADVNEELKCAISTLSSELLLKVAHYAILHGNGNVIAIVELVGTEDDSTQLLRHGAQSLSSSVATIRVDGVLFFYPHHRRGPRMKFFDRDGTPELMCGNGLRCVARYAVDRGVIAGSGAIVTDDGTKRVQVTGDLAEVVIGSPRQVRKLSDHRWFAFTGVAHLVEFVDSAAALDAVDVSTHGARLSHDPALCRLLDHPGGVHVNFVAPQENHLAIRTYEVGVEDETRCCGTGAAASAYLSWCAGFTSLPAVLRTRGGEVRIAYENDDLTLAGPVRYVTEPRPAPRSLRTVKESSA
jgi:diaminopimelate epimerase